MGLRINTNVASLQAQNKLAATTKKLNQSLTRLSTGLKINSGKDDGVGLAKSEALRAKIRGGEVARSNMAKAGAVLGVAEGYMAQLTEIAQNLRELAVQAADETISSADRTSLTDNLNTLVAEYNRLADGANFNGVKLLDGSFIGQDIQAGIDESETIGVTISDARSAAIGKIALFTSQTRTSVLTTTTTTNLAFGDAAGITIAGTALATTDFTSDGVSNVEKSESALAYVRAINSKSGTTGVTATVLANVQTFTYTSGATLDGTMHLLINGVTVKNTTTSYTISDQNATDLAALINAKSSSTGVVASVDTANDKLVLTASDGRNIDVTVTGADTTVSSNAFGFTGSSSNRASVFRGTFKLTANSAFSITGASAEFAAADPTSVALSETTTLDDVSFTTAANAGTAISIMDKVLEQLQSRRSAIGQASNRLDIADSEMGSRIENLSAAESIIRDADIASETAKYTQASILQQAGATVLAQANSAPQIALTLLQNL